MTTQTVSSGVTSSGLTENFGDQLIVVNGGVASATNVSGGLVAVSSGGSTVSTRLSSGGSSIGQEVISSGGSATGTVVLSGGVETVLSGGSAINANVSGGFMQLGTPAISATPASAGGTATGTVIDGGGVEVVLNGGVDSGATIRSGSLGVSSGGLSISATASAVSSGALAIVSVQGGVASATTIGSGGLLAISSGGVVVNETILAGGSVFVDNGGVYTLSASRNAQNISIASGGAFNLLGTASAVSVNSGGTETVSSGGLLTGNSSSGNGVFGTLNVLAGGTADHLYVSGAGANVQLAGNLNGFGTFMAGTTLTVSSGGAVSGASGSGTAMSGTANVLSGGSFEFVSINGGTVNLSAGAIGDHMTVSSGGNLNVAGTVRSNTAISAGGVETVLSGGLISGASGAGTGVSGGTLNVQAGGSAAFVGVYSGGTFNLRGTLLRNMGIWNGGVVNVSSGGIVTGATSSGTSVSSGGRLNVLSGGFAEQVKVYNRGFEMVYAGATISHTAIIGGTLELASGAIVDAINFSGTAGGVLKIDGVVSGATIMGFGAGNYIDLTGITYVSSGTASLTSGNVLHIVEGAQSFDIALNPSDDFSGKTFVLASDSAAGTSIRILGDQVGGGQTLAVSSGQTSNGLEVQNSGTVNVLSGGMAAATIVSSGGLQNVSGVVSSTQVLAGGREVIMSGGQGSFLTVSGDEVISSGGVADHIGVYAGGTLTVLGTLTSGAIIYAGATETVSSGGLVSGQIGSGTGISGGLVNVLSGGEFDFATAYSGGILNISAGATSFNIAASSGGQVNLAGTIVSNALVAAGGLLTVSSGGVLTGSSGAGITDSGTINVLSGGFADNVYVGSGGVLNDAGVVRSNLNVQAGGVVNVQSGGMISGNVYPGSSSTGYGASVSSGGILNISAGGSAMYLGVSGGGALNVLAGGSIQRFTVSSGGIANIFGVVTNNQGILAGGLEIVSSGGFASGLAGSGTGLFGGALQVLSGGQIDRIAVYAGGQFYISRGATGDHIAVSSGGVMYDAGALGGIVNISAGGSALISSGGTASGINVSGGTLELAAGASVSAVTFVGTGGELAIDGTGAAPSTVIFGFTAGNRIEFSNISSSQITSLTLTAGNILKVATTTFGTLSLYFDPAQTFSGQFTSAADGAGTDIMFVASGGVVVSSGTNLFVSSGQTSNGLNVQFGGSVTVLSGGTVSSTVLSGGFENVGGRAVGTMISSGGQEMVVSGGVASNTMVLSGGIQTVLKGGAAVGTTVSTMGYMQLGAPPFGSASGSAGGTATGTILRGGGLVVSSGGVATSTTAMGDGVNIGGLSVLSGGAVSGTVVSSGGAVTVLSGGSAAATTVLNSGFFGLGQGPFGSAPGSAGGSATGTVVSSGGIEVISSGGVDTGALVRAGAGQTVSSGGVSISATIWGNQFVSGGTVSNTIVSSGGTLNIWAGATVVDETILAGGGVFVGSGGIYTLSAGRVAQNINVASGGAFNLRGSASGAYVNSGATETVSSGGVMTGNTSVGNTTLGTLNVLAGGAVDHLYVSGAGANVQLAGTLNGFGNFQSGTTLTVSSGGLVSGVTGSGTGMAGTANVLSGGSLGFVSINGGTVNLSAGATGDHMTVSSGGQLNVAGTILSNIVVSSGGIETVLSGGFLSGQVYSGSGNFGTSVQGGTLNIQAGGSAAFVGVSSNGKINVAGTILSNTAVSSGGVENVLSGGVISGASGSGTAVYAGGILNVSSGGSAAHVGLSGGILNLLSGATAFNVSVSSGGSAYVAGALTSNTTVFAGGLEYVSAGGSAGATSIQGGTLEIANGGLLNGDVTFAGSGGILRIHGTTLPTGVISGLAIGNTIDLMDINFGSGGTVSLQSGGMILHIVENSVGYDLHLDGATSSALRFGLSKDSGTGTLVTLHTDLAPAVTVTSSSITATHGQASVAASTLFTTSDPEGDAITQYDFWDTEGNGHWTINGATGTTSGHNYVAAANLGTVNYTFGTVADTLYIRAFDGTAWSTWQQITANPAVNHAPVVTVTSSSITAAHGQASVAASTLFTANDPDSDAITQYDFWDTEGNGHWTINGATGTTSGHNYVAAANLGTVNYTFGTVADTLYIRAFDGTAWSTWQQITANPAVNHAPVVTVTSSSITAAHGQASVAASTLFTANDPDSDAITQYDFWDDQGSGHWTINGQTGLTNDHNIVAAANLGTVSYTFGTTTDTLYIRAFDGTAWSKWQQLTATPAVNHKPVVSVATPVISAVHNQSVLASSLISAFDPDGDTITRYDFWDDQGNGHWNVNGGVGATTADNFVDAANLGTVSYTFGTATDTLWVRAYDGATWSAWQQITATPVPNRAPVVTVPVSTIVAAHGQTTVAASSLFSSSDMDGDAITKYDFWDTQGNGHWTINGSAGLTNTDNIVAAGDLSQVSYAFGSAPDTLYIRAFDGVAWSTWQPLTAVPAINHAPVVTMNSATVTAAQGQTSVAASTLFTVNDADGDTITKYAFWDDQGNGHWTINGVAQATNAEIDVASINLSQVGYMFGSATDTLWVRAFDGTTWGKWQALTASPAPNTPPVVTAANVNTVANQILTASNLFNVTDADGDTMTKYAFWDTQGNGHWAINGAAQATNAEIDVAAANLSQVSYVAGTGTDQLFVRAFDGTAWGAWQQFTATGNSAATVANGATLHLGASYNGAVTFAGSTGTLMLDNSTSFAGTVAGMTGSDAINLTDINFATIQTPTFNGDSSGGTLSVTDGVHTANIALLGNYLASTFTTSSNGHGGTLVVDPPANSNSLLSPPQSA